MKQIIKKYLKKLPYLKGLYGHIELLKKQTEGNFSNKQQGQDWVPSGHFYSPIPNLDDVKKRENIIFDKSSNKIEGIDLREDVQLLFFEKLAEYYKDMPFGEKKREGLRYFFENTAFSYADGIFLHTIIRHLKPKRIIEVGSGYSSCVTLDTNEIFFNNAIECTFIEPYPQLLESLIKEDDKKNVKIISKNLQEVDLEEFSKLEAGDILFIDSTHVSKIDSDVNYIFFKLLPYLKKGVYIHFHDIFFPFEYPKNWIYEGRAWNEDYLMRAFLQYNNSFEIVFFIDYMQNFHENLIREKMGLALRNGGGGIWIEKVG
mgnify:CR=1 FL=1